MESSHLACGCFPSFLANVFKVKQNGMYKQFSTYRKYNCSYLYNVYSCTASTLTTAAATTKISNTKLYILRIYSENDRSLVVLNLTRQQLSVYIFSLHVLH